MPFGVPINPTCPAPSTGRHAENRKKPGQTSNRRADAVVATASEAYCSVVAEGAKNLREFISGEVGEGPPLAGGGRNFSESTPTRPDPNARMPYLRRCALLAGRYGNRPFSAVTRCVSLINPVSAVSRGIFVIPSRAATATDVKSLGRKHAVTDPECGCRFGRSVASDSSYY